MDSLTQFVLGAAVGEAVLGKKVGNKAIVWGGVGGTIPDLDVFFNPLFDEASAVMFHRGISHSVFFPLIMAPLLGFLVHRLHSDTDRIGWIKLFFWTIITHPFLDLFTGYGTGLLEPFFDYRFQLDTIFIIDPLYTVPMLIAVITCLFFSRNSSRRMKVNLIGIGLAHFYLAYTIYHKVMFAAIVTDNIREQSIPAERYMTAPAPLNNFLWWALIEKENEYLVGYYSFFDQTDNINFISLPKSHDLLGPLSGDQGVETLIKFTKGYYTVSSDGNSLVINDLRFGTVSGWFDLSKDFIFSFELQPINGNIYIKRKPASSSPSREDFKRLMDRIKGI